MIKDKFRNDDNGRDALTKAYRELQSEKDKISGEIKKQATELQPLRQMDEFLKENPKIVEKLAAEVEREQKGLQSPPKPEDYDVYDESVEGTSSYKWRQAQDEYLVRRGADRAVQELNKFKLDVARQEQIRKEDELLKTEFKLNREDIESYRSFCQVLTTSTIVTQSSYGKCQMVIPTLIHQNKNLNKKQNQNRLALLL